MSEMTPVPEQQIDYVQWIENLRVDLAESVGGVILRGARPVSVGMSAAGTTKPTSSAGALVGYAIRNMSTEDDATVRVLFYDGDVNGGVILPLTLAPGESARDWFGPGGINLRDGLFLDIDGAVEGSVYLRGVE